LSSDIYFAVILKTANLLSSTDPFVKKTQAA